MNDFDRLQHFVLLMIRRIRLWDAALVSFRTGEKFGYREEKLRLIELQFRPDDDADRTSKYSH